MSKDLAAAMADFLRILALEVENNRSLAKRLAVPFEDFLEEVREKGAVKEKKGKKAKAALPEGFDPFQVYYDRGRVGLYEALSSFDTAALKAVIAHFSLDPSRSYTRWRKPEKLMELIVEKVKAGAERGKAFGD